MLYFPSLNLLDELFELLAELGLDFGWREHRDVHEVSGHLDERLRELLLQDLVQQEHAVEVTVLLPLHVLGDLTQALAPSFYSNSFVALEAAVQTVSLFNLNHHCYEFLVQLFFHRSFKFKLLFTRIPVGRRTRKSTKS